MSHSIQDLLKKHHVTASAPCRIDSGGTWDIKAMALPMGAIVPTTVNVALNLRTFTVLSPYQSGWVKISSEGFPRGETGHKNQLPLNSSFALFFAAVSYFDFHGLQVHISSRSPVKSALGGSSTALVALIKALARVSAMIGGKKLARRDILHLAYHLEDAVSGGNCGLQDQAAAVYGGVNQWNWLYGNRSNPLERRPLLDKKGQKRLSQHLLVAYSGKSHVSAQTNNRWIKDFLSGHTRAGWIKVNEIVNNLAKAIANQNWAEAAQLIRQEMSLRRKLTPEALIPCTEKLVEQAENMGCGARFAGAGAGGAIWALGEAIQVRHLRNQWEKTLMPIKGAKILDCRVDGSGVK